MLRPDPRRRSTLRGWRIALVAVALLALVVVVTIIRVNPPERARPIEIATSEWMPYIGSELPEDGPVAELLSAVLGGAGYAPEFRFTTWPNAEQEVRNGSVVGMAPVVESDARADFAIYSDPLLDFRYTLFGRKGQALDAMATREDLRGVRVGRIEGYKYWKELDESGATFSDYSSSLEAFTALEAGTIDLVAEGSIAGTDVLMSPDFQGDASGYAEVEPHTALTSSTQALHLLVDDSPEGRRIVSEVNASLARFKETGDYRRIVGGLSVTADQVILIGAGTGAVDVFGDDGTPTWVTPRGSRASVLAWPDPGSDPSTLVEVKVEDGPLAGRVVHVRLQDVEVDNA